MIPKKVNILGKDYSISLKRRKGGTLGDVVIYGRANHLKNSIWINPQVNIQQRKETLLHEIIHVVNEELCLRFSEATVSRLSVGLYGVLKQNKIGFK